jgi:hypothetical protein
MVPRRRNARGFTDPPYVQTQKHEPVLFLGLVLVSGPITALAAASPPQKVNIFWGRTSGPYGGRKEGRKDVRGSVNPIALRRRGTTPEP